MPDLTPEQKKALAEVPRGTWALTISVVLVMFLAWMAMYIGKFLAQGPVN